MLTRHERRRVHELTSEKWIRLSFGRMFKSSKTKKSNHYKQSQTDTIDANLTGFSRELFVRPRETRSRFYSILRMIVKKRKPDTD